MFDLLTGVLPFRNSQVVGFVEYLRQRHEDCLEVHDDSWRQSPDDHTSFVQYMMGVRKENNIVSLLDFLDFSACSHVSKEAVGIIKEFLEVDESKRLGSGKTGIKDVKSHPYFKSVNWSKLAQKHVVPPYIPTNTYISHYETQNHAGFNEMIMSIDDNEYLLECPKSYDQKYFSSW